MLARPLGKERSYTLSICRQCQLLGVPRSSYYYWRDHHEEQERLRQELFAEEKEFAELVMSNWVEHPVYGYQKMARHLQKNGHPEAREKRVRKVYRQLGLQGLVPRFKTTRSSRRKEGKFPYLLRNRKIRYVNECWSSDYSDDKVFPISL
jgi:putative transposase